MDEIKRLHVRRGAFKAQLTGLEKMLAKVGDDVAGEILVNLENRSKQIQEMWVSFLEIQQDIELLTLDQVQIHQTELEERGVLTDKYFTFTGRVDFLLRQARAIGPRGASVGSPPNYLSRMGCSIKLPTIELPTFDGSFTKWRGFFDAFSILIDDNRDLTKIQKLTYLKSSLRGEPSDLISTLESTEENYSVAMELLKSRYDNKKRIIYNHVLNLLNIPVARESPTQLRELINNAQSNVNCLKAMGQPVDEWNAILVPLIVTKLDGRTVREWETKIGQAVDNASVPTFGELLGFLNCKLVTLETVNSNKYDNKIQTKAFVSTSSGRVTCPNCKGDHFIYNCDSFLKSDDHTKNTVAKNLELCIKCLKKGHYARECRSGSNCRFCGRGHHSLLHVRRAPVRESGKENIDSVRTSRNYSLINNTENLLATALVRVKEREVVCEARALLDSASQSNFVTESLCELLKLKRTPIEINVRGISKEHIKIDYSVKITIYSRVNGFYTTIDCLVVPMIAEALPSFSFDSTRLDLPANIRLADPYFSVSKRIDLLIGSTLFWRLMCVGQVMSSALVCQKTKLGWVIAGDLWKVKNANKVSYVSLERLSRSMERLWKDESATLTCEPESDKQYCEEFFKSTTTRDSSGRFVVELPFKGEFKSVGSTYEIARSRFMMLEKRLRRRSELRSDYIEFMREYEHLNHMREIKDCDTSEGYYLPHHCVIREESETTKLRVVFDGSCKGSGGASLNSIQHIGTMLQDDIFAILIRFRAHQYVITADIAKMYRQILVHPKHRRYQRVLWRENESERLKTYELATVTYGMACAPFLATRCLMELADQCENEFPTESRVVRRDFYVDDMITGGDSIERLKEIKKNVTQILASAGFELRKFESNVRELSEPVTMSRAVGGDRKTLGIVWNAVDDSVTYSVGSVTDNKHVTKRSVLTAVAQLYDPLGLLAPTIVVAKIIVQELWQLRLGWDESVPMNIHSRWTSLKNNLCHLSKISVPRKVVIGECELIELHAFSDASMKAYGACVYIKSINKSGDCCVVLLAAKSRVAPLKHTTLPRLELNAAVLAVRLVSKVKKTLDVDINKTIYWCDSQIVVCWIKSDSKSWNTYVTNRISEIRECSGPSSWRYVKSAENPADFVSRGVPPELLGSKSLWWKGPTWLFTPEGCPDYGSVDVTVEEMPEKRKNIQNFKVTEVQEFDLVDRFSDFNRLTRVVAYCIRFANNLRAVESKREMGPLRVEELQIATNGLVRHSQGVAFSDVLKKLSCGNLIEQRNDLFKLAPFLDGDGLIRVGGRLSQSLFGFNKKHPIILPKKSKLTRLIIKCEHERLMHAGPRMTLSGVREKFWPISGMNETKRVIRDCVKCARINARVEIPTMGDLPIERVTAIHPFHSVGVDYAGPYQIKERMGRGIRTMKCYVCVYVCFAIKAVHLELVTDLSTNAFLLSLKRFIARRGKPKSIFSDNGSNFVGARNELVELGNFLKTGASEIESSAAGLEVDWRFIPPGSPSFGGLWEAAVKIMKYHLKRVLMNTILTYEEFNTLLIQVEAILNSRPLTPLTSDPNDLNPLTPAHFLIGRTFISIPDPNLCNEKQNRLTRFQLLQQVQQQFWRRWSEEYVSQLQQRSRVAGESSAVDVGTMVVLRDENLPPARWRLGRVVLLHPGADGVVRVVTVRCADGEYKRAVRKICVLPVENKEQEHH